MLDVFSPQSDHEYLRRAAFRAGHETLSSHGCCYGVGPLGWDNDASTVTAAWERLPRRVNGRVMAFVA